MDIRKALMRRAELLGEGLNGGASMGSYGLTGGMRKPKTKKQAKKRVAKGITGGAKKKVPKRNAMGITGGRKRVSKKGGVVPRQLLPWMKLVKEVRQMHPEKSYKMILQMASKMYRQM